MTTLAASISAELTSAFARLKDDKPKKPSISAAIIAGFDWSFESDRVAVQAELEQVFLAAIESMGADIGEGQMRQIDGDAAAAELECGLGCGHGDQFLMFWTNQDSGNSRPSPRALASR